MAISLIRSMALTIRSLPAWTSPVARFTMPILALICSMAAAMSLPAFACSSVEVLTKRVISRIFSAARMICSLPAFCSFAALRELVGHLVDLLHGLAHLLHAARLLGRRPVYAPAHVPRRSRPLEDLPERLAGIAGQPHAVLDDDGPFLHGVHRLAGLFLNGGDQRADLLGRCGGPVRQLPDLGRHHGKSLSVLAGLRRNDRRVQGKQAGLVRDVLDDGQNAADALGPLAQPVHHVCRVLRIRLDPAHALDRLVDGPHAQVLRVGGNRFGERRRLPGCRLHLLDGRADLAWTTPRSARRPTTGLPRSRRPGGSLPTSG